MLKIGNYEIIGKVMLAPMAGITSSAYRKFMTPFGVVVSVTEMVSDCGIIYGNKETWTYTEIDETEPHPIGLQLFGSDPENLKKAVLKLKEKEFKFDFIDINMGCPVPKVTKAGSGSALMKDPKKVGDLIRAVKEVSDVPVSAKIRLGWDDKSINYLEVIKELENAGVFLIGIHARTTKQLYSGKAQYELIKNLREKMNVPLAVSGDIFTLEDAINAMNITKADLVMVARGGVGNPYLVTQIDHYFKTGEKLPDSTLDKQLEYCLKLADLLIEEKGEKRAMSIYRGIASKFISSIPNSKKYRLKLSNQINTREDLVQILNEIKENSCL